MHLKQKLQAVTLLLLISLAFPGTGCDNGEFRKRISDFQESVDLVSTVVGTYYTEMNEFERDLYLQDVLLHPEMRISAQGAPPTLFGPFNEESIRARMDAISLLGRYGQRLAELAGTDAPERFSEASKELGTNLFGLSNTFKSLVGAGDPSAADFVTPIATIVGAFGKIILEQKRDKKLRAAIDEAAPAVRKVIDLLEADFTTVIVPQRLTGNIKSLQNQVKYYNCLDRSNTSAGPPSSLCPSPLPQASFAERRDLLNRIKEATMRYELFKVTNPAEGISGMRDAHEALVKYAGDRSPQNLAALVSALDSFRSRAQLIADAVIQIRNLRRGES